MTPRITRTSSNIARAAAVARRSSLVACTLAMLLAGLFLPGCNILGPAIYFIHGPDKVPGVYTLDPTKTYVVFIDDRSSRIPLRSVREIIGKTAEDTLLSEKVVKDMIQSRAIQAVITRERYGKPMGIAEVGLAVDAQVVIYAFVDSFTLSTDGQTFSPAATLRVKVIDCVTKERLFPDAESPDPFFPLKVSVPPDNADAPKSTTERTQSEQDLARWVGRAIAQMFYDHDPLLDPKKLNESEHP